MSARLSLSEIRQVLEWCEGVERGDIPWVPNSIPLYRRLSKIHAALTGGRKR